MSRSTLFSVQVLDGEEPRLVVRGDVDLDAEDRLVEAARSAVAGLGAARTDRTLVLDLAAVTFLDSSGLRALLRSQALARSQGVTVRVVALPGPVTRLLEVAGVADRFDYEFDPQSVAPGRDASPS